MNWFTLFFMASAWITGPSGVSYQLIEDRETWFNAKARCSSLGAQLVKIESALVNDFIKTNFLDTSGNYDDVWIGLSDQVNFGTWRWSDDSLLTGYQNWGFGQPNGFIFNQHCTAMLVGIYYLVLYDGEWNDEACDSALKFICMK